MVTYELVSYKPLDLLDLGPESFKAVMQLNEDPAAITVHADSPWQNLDDFIAHAKENPGGITIGNSGPGAVWHLAALKLEEEAGVSFSHIPHNGAKPAVTQLAGQHIDAVAVSPAEVLQYIKSGELRCLGIMAEERDPKLPDVPTFNEQGYELVHGTWRGLAVPKDTPGDVVQQLEEGFYNAFQSSSFQTTANNAMLGLKYRDSEAFQQYLQSEADSVANLLSDLDI